MYYPRIIIGAPRGTYPGGLGLRDLGNRREVETGLIYSCPVEPGECEGVRGDTDSYFSESMPAILNNDASIDNDQASTFLPPQYVEGRLFDQARKFVSFEGKMLLYYCAFVYPMPKKIQRFHYSYHHYQS